MAECPVHLPGPPPRDYVAFKLAVPDDAVETLDAAALKSDWAVDVAYSRGGGDLWLEQRRSLALAIPTAVLPESKNLRLNPAQPHARSLDLLSRTPFRFDPRLDPIC